MRYIIKQLKCDAVFHAAAYKHVPLMEENPVAVIENNVFGTKNLLDACLEYGVKRFVLISTDKAVEPVSVYGFSKMLNEKTILQAAQKAKDGSAYMFVRFGNVLGSRGSIFPLFVEQIKHGGPVTVTDKKMTRYFMTIPEACSLVLQAGGVGKCGESYLLDMGEPVHIYETAKQLIRYMGFEPEKDIKIEIIGIREGERLEEPLWSKTEHLEKTAYEKIMLLKDAASFKTEYLDLILEKLRPFCFYTPGKEDLFRNKDKMKEIINSVLDTTLCLSC